MTRFARAKGSKASNERVPNEATPWCEMKQQWADNSATTSDRPEKTKSAKELLGEDDAFYYDTTGNVNTDWAEFEPLGASKQATKREAQSNGNKASKKSTKKLRDASTANGNSSMQNSSHGSLSSKKSKKQKLMAQPVESVTGCAMENETKVELAQPTKQKSAKKAKKHIASLDSRVEENTTNVESTRETDAEPAKKKNKIHSSTLPVLDNKKDLEWALATSNEPASKKKKKNKDVNLIDSSAASNMENITNIESTHDTDCKAVKKKKKKRKDKKTEEPAAEICAATTEMSDAKQEQTEMKGSLIVSKRHKRNQKRIQKNALLAASVEKTSGEIASTGGFDAAGNDWSSNVNFGKRLKFETKENANKNRTADDNANDFKKPINRNGEANNTKKRKAPKIRDDKEHKRRKPGPTSMKCIINGLELEIVMFEGFPVKKEDAERLKDLRQQMVMKGIPKSEIDGAMKLERRRAEKSLARVRKQVCFHCRKAGHNLSDCPELGEEESATGICFKCGSTEHTHFECKVTKKEEFRFASCFICREQGHIAKQCPDNPKGLYPQGGACKICGDVTHLKKDCPDLIQEKEESNVTLSTIAGSTLESLDEDVTRKVTVDNSKRAKGKIVKF